jgi:ubiquinone/menaquinone biosynthesis C-methylase UbiE
MKLLAGIHHWFERPPRLLAVRRVLSRPGATLLDVGCGNHSATITKRHYPQCVYHGVDRQVWNTDARDEACTDAFFSADLSDPEALRAVPDENYDVVLCSHVLEHLPDPYAVVGRLLEKVKPGGMMYLEVPSPRSLRLPHAAAGWWGVRGCLNFYDDATHQTMVDLPRVASLLRESGFEVSPVKTRRLRRRVLLLPLYVLAGLCLRGYVPASVVWDVTGFAHWVVGRKPERVPSRGAHPQVSSSRSQAA